MGRAQRIGPTLLWLNSTGRYGSSIGVAYDIELSTPAAVVLFEDCRRIARHCATY